VEGLDVESSVSAVVATGRLGARHPGGLRQVAAARGEVREASTGHAMDGDGRGSQHEDEKGIKNRTGRWEVVVQQHIVAATPVHPFPRTLAHAPPWREYDDLLGRWGRGSEPVLTHKALTGTGVALAETRQGSNELPRGCYRHAQRQGQRRPHAAEPSRERRELVVQQACRPRLDGGRQELNRRPFQPRAVRNAPTSTAPWWKGKRMGRAGRGLGVATGGAGVRTGDAGGPLAGVGTGDAGGPPG
jgi:hypothetical protein